MTPPRADPSASLEQSSLEFRLLLAALPAAPEDTAVLPRLLASGPDWERVHQVARLHALVPLLYRRLLERAPELLPEEARARLRVDYQAGKLRGRMLQGRALAVLDLLRGHGVRAAPFKGPLLGALLYGEAGLRHCHDLDFIVHPEQFAQAADLLAGSGYRRKFHVGYAHAYLTPCGKVTVELHRQVAPSYCAPALNTAGLWEHTGSMEVAGKELETLRPEAMLNLLCVHGAKHLWARLDWTCDVAFLLAAHPALDWDGVLRHAGEHRVTRMLHSGLALAERLLGARLPAAVRTCVGEDLVVQELTAGTIAYLAAIEPHRPDRTAYARYLLRIQEHPRERTAYLFYLLSRVWQRSVEPEAR